MLISTEDGSFYLVKLTKPENAYTHGQLGSVFPHHMHLQVSNLSKLVSAWRWNLIFPGSSISAQMDTINRKMEQQYCIGKISHTCNAADNEKFFYG